MSVNGISSYNGYNEGIYSKKAQNNKKPVSFGSADNGYSSSVANSYIQKQQAQKQEMELKNQKKNKWKEFWMDVLKGVTIGGTIIVGTVLIASSTKAGREMAQTLTNSIGLTSTDGSDKIIDEFAKVKPDKQKVLQDIEKMPLSSSAKKVCATALISANDDAVHALESLKKSTSSGI